MKIPLIKPYITESIKQRVCDVLDSGYLTEGPVTREFENKLKEYLGCGYLHAVTSATTGLEVALRALGIGPGDEVIVPDYTYPATASVIAIVGAKAVIVDVSKEDMLLNFDALEAAINENTKAIIPTHLNGRTCNMDMIQNIADKHNLLLFEDAAQGLGSTFKGSHPC